MRLAGNGTWAVHADELRLPLGRLVLVVVLWGDWGTVVLRGSGVEMPRVWLLLSAVDPGEVQGWTTEEWAALDWAEVEVEEDAEGDWVLSPEAGVLDALAAEEWVVLSVGEGPGQEVLMVGGAGFMAAYEMREAFGLTCCPVPARFAFRQGRVVVPSCRIA